MGLKPKNLAVFSRDAPSTKDPRGLKLRQSSVNVQASSYRKDNPAICTSLGLGISSIFPHTHTKCCTALHKTSAGERHTKKANLHQRSRHPHTSTSHFHTRPRPAHPLGASRAHLNLRSLHVLTRAQRTRLRFCPRHRHLCHMGLYKLEFEFVL